MRGRNFIISAVLVACGGAISSVDGNKQVGTLDKNDQDQLCKDVANYVEASISPTEFKKFVCGISLSNSSDPLACQTKFQTCMNDPSKNISFSTMINCQGFATYLARCMDVTVSQFTECYKQYVDVVKTYASKMPICDRNQAQQAAIDATGRISQQCLQTLLKCANTSPGGMMDGGVPDATPPDSGGPAQDGGGGPPPDGG